VTTEHEAKRPPAHFLTTTICEMLAFDGKAYTYSIEQQMAWDLRFNKLCARHGDDKVTDLLGEYFESGRLKKSSRPGDFAEYVSDRTSDRWGHNSVVNPSWHEAVRRTGQHAASANNFPDEFVLCLITECSNDLMAAAVPADLPDRDREHRKKSEWSAVRSVLAQSWGKETVDRWESWRKEGIEEVRNSGGYRLPRLGGTR
jgi:hypothetical protein